MALMFDAPAARAEQLLELVLFTRALPPPRFAVAVLEQKMA